MASRGLNCFGRKGKKPRKSPPEEKVVAVFEKRRSKIRKCDFCGKPYIAVVKGNTNVEELRPGCPERVCKSCTYTPPTTLEGTLKEIKPGFFGRFPPEPKHVTFLEDPNEPGPSRISGKPYRDVLKPIENESLDDTTGIDEDEMFYSQRLSKIPRFYNTFDNLSTLTDQTMREMSLLRGSHVRPEDTIRLPEMKDCYVSSSRRINHRIPACELHRRRDSECWLGQDIQNIPENAYLRTADMYSKFQRHKFRRAPFIPNRQHPAITE